LQDSGAVVGIGEFVEAGDFGLLPV
jgi:hypothetical protein